MTFLWSLGNGPEERRWKRMMTDKLYDMCVSMFQEE